MSFCDLLSYLHVTPTYLSYNNGMSALGRCSAMHQCVFTRSLEMRGLLKFYNDARTQYYWMVYDSHTHSMRQ